MVLVVLEPLMLFFPLLLTEWNQYQEYGMD